MCYNTYKSANGPLADSMRQHTRRVFVPPVFDDENKTRVAALLHVVILVSIVFICLESILIALIDPSFYYTLPINLVLTLALLILYGMIRRGYVWAASLSLCGVFWLAISAAIGGNPFSPLIVTYTGVILIAALLVHMYAALFFAVISVVAIGISVFGPELGWFVGNFAPVSPRSVWIINAFLLPMMAIILSLAAHRISETLARVQLSSAALATANRALELNRARSAAILNALPDIIFRISRTGVFLDVLEASSIELLKARDEFIGKGVNETLPPDLAELTMTNIEQALVTQQMQLHEYHLDLSGERQYFEARTVPISSEEVISIVRDITARKKTEIALQGSEARFIKIFQNAPVSIAITRFSDGQVLEANPAYVALTGYTLEELRTLQNEQIFLWTSPDEREHAEQVILQTHRLENLQFHIRHKTGQLVDVLVSAEIMEFNDEQCLLLNVMDVSALKMSEKAREKAENRFSRILEVTGEAVIVIDEAHRIILFNPSAEKTFGYRAEEVLGQNLNMLLPESLWEKHNQYVNDFAVYGVTARPMNSRGGELVGKRRDGTLFPIEASISKLVEDDRQIFTVVLQDITERKESERRLLEAERLRVEVEKDRELIRFRERFLSTVSHEFRMPLSVILSSKEVLQHYYDRLSEERRAEHFQQIHKQVTRMEEMLADLLLFNRGESGMLKYEPAPVDLSAFCRHIINQFTAVEKNNHRFAFDNTGVFDDAVMDEKLLEHILNNLLGNAVKYSPENTEIRLTMQREGDQVVFKVRDAGIGIPEADQEKLFLPFERAGNAKSVDGTGLGLAIVKNCVQAHQGSITFETEEGVGTTFIVHLPLKPV